MKVSRVDLGDMLEILKKEGKADEDIIVYNGDGRLGRIAALAKTVDGGAVDTKSSFMSYLELYRYMQGVLFADTLNQ